MRNVLITISVLLASACTSLEVIPYAPPTSGLTANLTLKTDRMWPTTQVDLYIVKGGSQSSEPTLIKVGQLQNRNLVRDEVLSFEAKLPAGAPIRMYINYRYDGGVYVTGCKYPFAFVPESDKRYVIEFIKDTRTCSPRFYVQNGNQLSEISVRVKQ